MKDLKQSGAAILGLLLGLVVVFGVLMWSSGQDACYSCDIIDIVDVGQRILAAIMVFGGIGVITLLTIANKLHEQKELLEAQLEEAQKTNRALAAIYKRQKEITRQ